MKRKNNCYYFAPDAGAPCRDGSRRSPSTSTPRSSPQMLQVVRRAAPAPPSPADARRRQRGSCWGGGEFFNPRVSPPPWVPQAPRCFLGALTSLELFRGAGGARCFPGGGLGLGLPCSAARGGPPMSPPSPTPLTGAPWSRGTRASPRVGCALGAQPHGRRTPNCLGRKGFFFFLGGGRVRGERGRNCEPSSQG